MWCKYIVFVSLITADLLFPASCSSEQGVKIFEADLTSGSSKITKASNAKVCYMRTLGTNRGSEKCNLQGVIRITFPPSINGKQNCRLNMKCDQPVSKKWMATSRGKVSFKDLHTLLTAAACWKEQIGSDQTHKYFIFAPHRENS